MLSASPRPRYARFPLIRLQALAPLEQAVRFSNIASRAVARITQIMSNRKKPVRHNPGWLSDVSFLHYRNVPHSENRVIQYRSPGLFAERGIRDITLLGSAGWLTLFMPPPVVPRWSCGYNFCMALPAKTALLSAFRRLPRGVAPPIHPLPPSIYAPLTKLSDYLKI